MSITQFTIIGNVFGNWIFCFNSNYPSLASRSASTATPNPAPPPATTTRPGRVSPLSTSSSIQRAATCPSQCRSLASRQKRTIWTSRDFFSFLRTTWLLFVFCQTFFVFVWVEMALQTYNKMKKSSTFKVLVKKSDVFWSE